MTSARRSGSFALALACLLIACKGSHGNAEAPPDSAPADGATVARDASAVVALDAAPSDEIIPPTSSDELTARARHLLEAIAKDDGDLASDILFPRDAWFLTRDAADPGKDWEKQTANPFRKAVHALGRRREELERAQFVSIELGHAIVQATARRHGWKKPLWTVRGSRLTFVVDGHTRTLSIHEMTAWRGAWYVTRLR